MKPRPGAWIVPGKKDALEGVETWERLTLSGKYFEGNQNKGAEQSDRWHAAEGMAPYQECGMARSDAMLLALGAVSTQIIVSHNTPKMSTSNLSSCPLDFPL